MSLKLVIIKNKFKNRFVKKLFLISTKMISKNKIKMIFFYGSAL